VSLTDNFTPPMRRD